MTTTTTTRKRKQRHYSVPIEISGSCRVCHDFFTVYVFTVHGEQRIQETPRLKYVNDRDESTGQPRRRLVHRPDLCNGDVTLYGSPEQFTSEISTRDNVPAAAEQALY